MKITRDINSWDIEHIRLEGAGSMFWPREATARDSNTCKLQLDYKDLTNGLLNLKLSSSSSGI